MLSELLNPLCKSLHPTCQIHQKDKKIAAELLNPAAIFIKLQQTLYQGVA